MLEAKLADDAITCIRSIRDAVEVSRMSDEVRYELALKMSDAIHALYDGTKALASDDRDAAELWSSYLKHASDPVDRTRARNATSKLILHSRYARFPKYLSSIAVGLRRSGEEVTVAIADLMFSTLIRCPSWNKPRDELQCSDLCVATAKDALSILEAEIGPRPWVASTGRQRLETNAAALQQRIKKCEVSSPLPSPP